MQSPTASVPGWTTWAWRPRRRSFRPSGEFTNLSASTPKRLENFAQPVCGCGVISRIALPIFKRHYAAVNGEQTTVYPHVVEGLQVMREKGLELACITNKAGDFTLPLLARTGLAPYFRVVVSGDTTQEKKPHPAPLLYACAQFGISPNEAVMIGDSTNDALAGRNAGCQVLCVPYGYNEGGDVHDIDCDAIVDSLLDAANMLRPSAS